MSTVRRIDYYSGARWRPDVGLTGASVPWHPYLARFARMTHTWVIGWAAGSLEALVAESRAEGWDCIVIESAYNAPTTRAALSAVHDAGATVVCEADEIRTAFAAVKDRIVRSANKNWVNGPEADRRPLLLLVGGTDHVAIGVLEKIAYVGRAARVHLAVDEGVRPRTSSRFQECVFGVYRRSH